MAKTPDYVLAEDHTMLNGQWDTKILPAGTFVRPIEACYVPKHIKEEVMNRWFDPIEEYYCYTPVGIIIIPKKRIRRV